MRFVTWLFTNAVALAVATWMVDGIYFDGPTGGRAEIEDKILPLILVALVLGVVTSVVKPVLTILSIPFIVLTLGLFLVVINAAMLELTSWLSGQLDLDFHVDGFWPAVLGAVVITVVTWVVDGLIGQDERR